MANSKDTVQRLTATLREEGVDVEELDGLTADFGTWWFNLRPSNTEPLLRLNVEAPDEVQCSERVSEVLAMIKGV